MVDPAFALDERLRRDTLPVVTLGLCRLLLMNDSRWPWFILVPQRAGIVEIHDLQPLDQAMLAFETTLVSEELKRVTEAAKMNIGAIGNRVAQLHVHVVARNPDDPHWPDPVWGRGTAMPYEDATAAEVIDRMSRALLSGSA